MKAASETERLETLLAESDWVRRLAARLVGDPHDVDDLVQDTWSAALRRPPTWGDSPRRWLATVVRNAARHRARGADARRDRETGRARERAETTDASPEELLGRLELQEMLSRTVRELPEELADVVTLRYYEGLSSAEIARRRELPAGTVRWRLRRALEVLRERLDSRFDGDRPVWTAALLPLARSAHREAGAVSGGGLVAGLLTHALAMPLLPKIVALTVVTLLCALPFTSPFGGEDPAATGGRAAPATGPLAAAPQEDPAAGPVRTAAPQRTPAARADGADPAADVAGAQGPRTRAQLRVVDPFGNAVAGARVSIEPTQATRQDLQRRLDELGPLAALPALAEFTKTTGAHGTARFETDLIASDGAADALIEGPHYERATLRFPFTAGEDHDLGDVVLAPAGAVAGVVRSSDGSAFEAAFLSVGPAELPADPSSLVRAGPAEVVAYGQTDASGVFEITGVPVGTWRVFAHTWAGPWAWSDPLRVEAGERVRPVELTLPRGAELRAELVVLGPDGRPWPHASYRLTGPEGGVFSGPVGEDGRTDFTPSWESFGGGRLVVTDDRLLHRAVVVDPVPLAARPMEVRLERAATVERELSVVDAHGAPLADAHAVVAARGGRAATRTDRDGRALLTLPAAPESFDLTVRADGFTPHAAEALVAPAPDGRWQVTVRALPGITGVVAASDGAPLRGARVAVHALAEEGVVYAVGNFVGVFEPIPAATTRTAADGSFQLAHDVDGRLLLRVERTGFADAAAQLDPYDAERGATVDVALGRGGTLEGRVLDAAGAPVARVSVVLDHPHHEGRATRTDADGAFRFHRVPAGDWYVHAVSAMQDAVVTASVEPEDWEFPRSCSVTEGETTRHDLTLPDPARLRVAVHVAFDGTSAGEPRVGAGVPASWDPGGGWSWAEGESSEPGRFSVALERAARHRVVVQAEALAGSFRRSVEVDELPAELHARAALATLAGRVAAVDERGGRLVLAADVDGWAYEARVRVGASGTFGPLVVPAGALSASWQVRGEVVAEAVVELGAGEAGTLEL